MKYTFLTPGPTELYFSVDFHVKQALKKGIPSISHRSTEFQKIYGSIKENLKTLLNLPDDYKIFFTSSAREAWERIAQNLVSKQSFHLSNGAFADKFIDAVQVMGKQPESLRMPDGHGFDIPGLHIPESCELISITQNETSTGTRFPLEDISKIRDSYPDPLIAVDAVSSVPYENIDFSKIDCLYLSVQKCFGLPAGLGIWLLNERCVKKAVELQSSGEIIGSYHSIPSLLKNYEKNQTPETPNILGIYLLSKVIEDMLSKGIDQIRREINYKSAVMYQLAKDHDFISSFVKAEKIRSKTIHVFETDYADQIFDHCLSRKIMIGKGYGNYKNSQIRIANFPTHSKEFFEQFADHLAAFQPVNS